VDKVLTGKEDSQQVGMRKREIQEWKKGRTLYTFCEQKVRVQVFPEKKRAASRCPSGKKKFSETSSWSTLGGRGEKNRNQKTASLPRVDESHVE